LFGALLVAGIVHGLIIGLAAMAVTLVFGIARFPNAAAGDTVLRALALFIRSP